ncbi:P-loop containing nucleoside triphosphate hydrolase [Pleurotus pulmonarius]
MTWKWVKNVQNVLRGKQKDATVIILLGPAGSGRSSFINAAIGEAKLRCGPMPDNSLAPVTTDVESVHFTRNQKEYVFIDTPGLDLEETATELIDKASSKQAGVLIYLHRLSDPRVTIHPEEYDRIFKVLGGSGWQAKTVVATTMLVMVDGKTAAERGAQLRDNLLSNMIAGGTRLDSFSGTKEDAWRIVDMVVNSG